MPYLGEAQRAEDFGASIDLAEALDTALTWFGENLTPLPLLICAFDTSSCSWLGTQPRPPRRAP